MPRIPDVIAGHAKQQGDLLADIAHHNIAHAYLFSGPEGIGKTTVARWFAWRLLVEHLPPEQAMPVRQQMEKFINPDFLCLDDLWIEEVNEDWSVIGQSSNVPQQHRSKDTPSRTDTIGIDDLRAIAERLQATGDSPYMCCIIRGIERMQPTAATSFLKILEEPPSRVIFILTTDSPTTLLPTIVSRTRTLRFAPLKKEEMITLLDGRDDDDAGFALHIAQGAPGTLRRLLEDPDLLRASKQLHSQAKQFWQTTSLKDRMSWLMKATEKKQTIDDVLMHLGLTLKEYPDARKRSELVRAYSKLARELTTNAHKALILERFALAVQEAA